MVCEVIVRLCFMMMMICDSNYVKLEIKIDEDLKARPYDLGVSLPRC